MNRQIERRAVPPALERPVVVPPALLPPQARAVPVLLVHDRQRMAEETELYLHLRDNGWEDLGVSDCTALDLWRHPDIAGGEPLPVWEAARISGFTEEVAP